MILPQSTETSINLTNSENNTNSQAISFSDLEPTTNPQLAKPESTEQVQDTPVQETSQEETVKKEVPVFKAGKKIPYALGDQNLEIDPEIKLRHKVDGKEVEWTLQELLNDKAGHEGHDKRFQKLAAKEKEFSRQKEIVEKYIEGFQEVAKKGDALGAMEYLAQLAGISPVEFKKSLRNQIMPDAQKWLEMSEEQRRVKELEDEVNHNRQQRESESQKVAAQKAQGELDKQLRSAQETYGFSDSDLLEAHDQLAAHYKPEQITLQLMTDFMKEHNAVSKAEKLLSQVDTELVNNEKVLDSVADMILKARHSDEELLEFISGAYAKKPAKKRAESKSATAPVPVEQKHTQKQFISFADLD
jgi:hypothetical protein